MDNRRLKITVLRGLVIGAALSLTACTTITDYFTPDEEVELRVLEPIQNQFTPNTKWSEEVGDGVDKYFSRLRPVIGYNLLFAASRQGDVIAFNPETGDTVWKQDFADYSSDGESGWFSSLWSDGMSAKIAGGLSLAYEKLYFGTETVTSSH